MQKILLYVLLIPAMVQHADASLSKAMLVEISLASIDSL